MEDPSVVAISSKTASGVTTPARRRTDEESIRARETWGRPLEFLLSCMASSVGLGNVWRFPKVLFENGGGAFLIPYFVMMIIAGRPLYFLELSFGQFTSYGPIKAWQCVPFLRGVGVGQVLSTFYVITYYVVLSATCIYFIGACFNADLPWRTCDPTIVVENVVCVNSTDITKGECLTPTNTSCEYRSSSELYFVQKVLRLSKGIDEVGEISWSLALCLLLCWIFLFLSVIKGVRSSGKTSYVTALFPYIVLIALLMIGLTLEGSGNGIMYFITPQWKMLLKIEVWYRACEQMFFSLTVGYGVLIMYASYNDFRHNITRDAILLSLIDTFTSILSGFTTFSIMGALAHDLNKPVEDVVDSGHTLVFVAYPEALGRLKFIPQLWGVLFFLMLLSLAIGTSVGDVVNVTTTIHDQFPKISRWIVVLTVCVVSYLIGLIYITRAGHYIFNLVDDRGAGFSSFIFAIAEVTGLMWIYGVNNYCRDMSFMFGYKVGLYWKITWAFITPATLIFIFVYFLTTVERLTYGDNYVYPPLAEGIGWFLGLFSIFQIPLWGAVTIWKADAPTFYGKIKKSFRPTPEWGPRERIERKAWEITKQLPQDSANLPKIATFEDISE